MKNILKIGDKVMWSGSWGKEMPKEAKVISIEINCTSKAGDAVSSVDWDMVNDQVILSFDNGHWAYGYQITQI